MQRALHHVGDAVVSCNTLDVPLHNISKTNTSDQNHGWCGGCGEPASHAVTINMNI